MTNMIEKMIKEKEIEKEREKLEAIRKKNLKLIREKFGEFAHSAALEAIRKSDLEAVGKRDNK